MVTFHLGAKKFWKIPGNHPWPLLSNRGAKSLIERSLKNTELDNKRKSTFLTDNYIVVSIFLKNLSKEQCKHNFHGKIEREVFSKAEHGKSNYI